MHQAVASGPVASVRTGPDPGSQDLLWPGLWLSAAGG